MTRRAGCEGGRAAVAFSAVVLAGALLALATPEPAQAVCSVLSRHPCTPYVGSVFRRQPFTPYSCGVFSGPGCQPELMLPLNQVPVLKVEGHVGPSEPLDREHPVDRLYDLGPLLSRCLEMPPDDEVRPGMQVTLKFAFKRNGELLADPRFTYTTHEASDDEKKIYRDAALDMLKRCTPLPITAELGRAIAGRPLVAPIIETRTERKADVPGGGGATNGDVGKAGGEKP